MFVTTKLWISDYGYEPKLSIGFDGLPAAPRARLHRPLPAPPSRPDVDFDGDGRPRTRRCEQMLARGARPRDRRLELQRAAPRELDATETGVVPAVNQVELHPFFTQERAARVPRMHGIATQAWSPLGGINVYRPADPSSSRIRSSIRPVVGRRLQARQDARAGGCAVRSAVDTETPRFQSPCSRLRIKGNIDIFDFVLTSDEVAAIDELDSGARGA